MSSSTSSHCSDYFIVVKVGFIRRSDNRRLRGADPSFFDSWLVSLYPTVLLRTVKPIIKTYIYVSFITLYCETWKMFHCWRYLFSLIQFQSRHCVDYRSVQVDYSQVISITVRSNLEKDRRHTHGAAGEPNNSCGIANINLYSDNIIDKFTRKWALSHWADVCNFTSGFIPEINEMAQL